MAGRFRWSVNVYIIFLCVRSSSSKFHHFPFYVSFREQSLRTTSGTIAQMFSKIRSLLRSLGSLAAVAFMFFLVWFQYFCCYHSFFNSDRMPECCQFSSTILRLFRFLIIHEISIYAIYLYLKFKFNFFQFFHSYMVAIFDA